MKGSPMLRNFGIGASPAKQKTAETVEKEAKNTKKTKKKRINVENKVLTFPMVEVGSRIKRLFRVI